MPVRWTRVIVGALVLTVLAVATMATVLVIRPPQQPQQGTASLVGGPFALVDQDGATVTDASMQGKPFLVFFGFTNCPDVCPTTLFELSQVLNSLGKDAGDLQVLFVSVDPDRDTPEAMKRYLSSFNSRIHGLTGDAEAVAQIVKAYRAYSKKVPLEDGSYTMDHTAVVYLMDGRGRFVSPLNMSRTPAEIAAELKRVL